MHGSPRNQLRGLYFKVSAYFLLKFVQVELFKKCVSTQEDHTVIVSKPEMEMKTLPWCDKIEVLQDHNKTTYKCNNVTKQHCTSLWKIVNGAKVWAGNDDCRNVTWEECKPTIKTVKWMVPSMNCTPEPFTFLTFKNETTDLTTENQTCTVEKKPVCYKVPRRSCGSIVVHNCTEVFEFCVCRESKFVL